MPGKPTGSAAATITEYHQRLSTLGPKQAGHLSLTAMAAMKWLVLNAKSDDTRFAAARELLNLPHVRSRLVARATGAAAKQATPRRRTQQERPDQPDATERLRALLRDADPETLESILDALDKFERQDANRVDGAPQPGGA